MFFKNKSSQARMTHEVHPNPKDQDLPGTGMRKFLILIPLIILSCARQVINQVEPETPEVDILAGPVIICDSALLLTPITDEDIDSLEAWRWRHWDKIHQDYHLVTPWSYGGLMCDWQSEMQDSLEREGKSIIPYYAWLREWYITEREKLPDNDTKNIRTLAATVGGDVSAFYLVLKLYLKPL
jgi:hypothetical protein